MSVKNPLRDSVSACIVYLLYLFLVVILFDVFFLHGYLGLGYSKSYKQENIQRYPAPYVAFTGKPNAIDHNEFGFRGSSFAESGPEDIKIAFFGGSTGYSGSPTIAEGIEKELKILLNKSVFVANYSVVSSNHRQHLHGIIEFLPQFRPDMVIFYGGYNETIQNAKFDPRPGYPYNYFYRAETRPFFKLLLENSAIAGELDKKFRIFTNLKKLREAELPYSPDWNRRIVDKYFETLELANKVTNTMNAGFFERTKFLAFYQPYQVPRYFQSAHRQIRNRIAEFPYVHDVSHEYDSLGREAYRDIVHVNQDAKNKMARSIANIIAESMQRPGS